MEFGIAEDRSMVPALLQAPDQELVDSQLDVQKQSGEGLFTRARKCVLKAALFGSSHYRVCKLNCTCDIPVLPCMTSNLGFPGWHSVSGQALCSSDGSRSGTLPRRRPALC